MARSTAYKQEPNQIRWTGHTHERDSTKKVVEVLRLWPTKQDFLPIPQAGSEDNEEKTSMTGRTTTHRNVTMSDIAFENQAKTLVYFDLLADPGRKDYSKSVVQGDGLYIFWKKKTTIMRMLLRPDHHHRQQFPA